MADGLEHKQYWVQADLVCLNDCELEVCRIVFITNVKLLQLQEAEILDKKIIILRILFPYNQQKTLKMNVK